MIKAYDENGNVARCADCRFYNRKGVYCENDKNCYRGSGNEYAFSLDYVDTTLDLLSAEECDEWVCGDFERKGR